MQEGVFLVPTIPDPYADIGGYIISISSFMISY